MNESQKQSRMKSLFTSLFLFYLFIGFSQKPSLTKGTVQKHKIATVTELFQRYDEKGMLIPENHKSFIELYNKNGTLSKRIIFTPNNKKKETHTFHYNRKGLLDGTITKDPLDKIIDKHSTKYNTNGLVVLEKGLTTGNEYTLEYSYNKNKQLVSRIKKDISKNVLTTKTFTYTPEGKVKTESFKNKTHYLKTFEYNTKGQKTKETFHKDSIVNYTLEFVYTPEGKILTEEKYDEIGRPIYRMSFTYTTNGKVSTIEQQYGQVMGGYFKKWRYYYNEDNNISEIKVYDIDTTAPVMVTKYIYKKIK